MKTYNILSINEFKTNIENNSRLLGIDPGNKNIGFAICDENKKVATPLKIIQKTKDGSKRRYAQFVESIRTEKGPRQKILVNIGRIDTKSGSKMIELLAVSLIEIIDRLHILNITKDVEGKESKEMGCSLVFKKLDEQIGIKKLLKKAFKDITQDTGPAE